MSSLADRLRGIVAGVGTGGPAGAGALAERAAHAVAGRVVPDESARVLGGRVEQHPAGTAIRVTRHYPADARYGHVRLGEAVAQVLEATDAFEVLTRAWPSGAEASDARRPALDDLWLLDLETTGLAGGAGTQAFLIGCAHLSAGGVTVEQWLLPGFEHERALLALFAEWSKGRGTLVTFNGKSFDVPLIDTRYQFHRTASPLAGVWHTDMLHPARRLWRLQGSAYGPVEGSCSLGTLEQRLAGVARVGDVPGAEIPGRYFQFVRDGEAAPLEPVLEHNRLDLVSLVLVLSATLQRIARGPASTRDAYEALGLARVYERAGQWHEADAAYSASIQQLQRVGRDPSTLADVLRRQALLRRRQGRTSDAAAVWSTLAALRGAPTALRREAREALAIFHEHRDGNLWAARQHVNALLSEVRDEGREAAQHRLHRIERKLQARSGTDLLGSTDRAEG
jgi:uncharacterized protein YprB with RNaseH-like and TPR domain